MKFSIYLTAILTFLFSCELSDEKVELDREFQFVKGKTYEFMDYELELTKIVDSRCPLNVNCIWEGEAKLSFELRHDDEKMKFHLNTNENLTYHFQDYRLRIISVAPHPSSDEDIEEDDYRVSVCIEAN